MLFISVEDFFSQVSGIRHLSRTEEIELAQRMAEGDAAARDALVRSYLPMVAAHIRRAPQEIRTLHTVYTCIVSLQKGVDCFNFLQENESFVHHLSWRLRQCITRCIAQRP